LTGRKLGAGCWEKNDPEPRTQNPEPMSKETEVRNKETGFKDIEYAI
jgi:hypothetical protein